MIDLKGRYPAAVAAAALVLALALPAATVSANPGLRVSGAICKGEVIAGKDYTHTMTISSREEDSPMDVLVEVRGFSQSPEGACQAIDAAEDASPYSACSFITLDVSSFHLEPGASQEVVADISIPEDATGGRYAVIYVHTQPVGAGQVGIISAINVPVYLTIKDSQLVSRGEITEIPATEVTSGEAVAIETMFRNTGNHDFKIKGEVTVADSGGTVLETIFIPETASSVIPGMVRQLEATFIPEGELPLGSYSIQSKVMLEDGTILDEASGSFEVKEAYVPPAAAASVTLNPGSASVLTTEDGRISINFPKGSVTGQVEVSVQSYPPSQLPPLAAEPGATAICFRVDGLTGLLLEKATITVKYTQTELDAAGGDASRLKLARWDEAQGEWSVLKTTVDEQAMTLTAETDQLSIWAVVVGGVSSSGTIAIGTMELNMWIVIGGGAGVVLVIVLLIYFLAVRRRRAF